MRIMGLFDLGLHTIIAGLTLAYNIVQVSGFPEPKPVTGAYSGVHDPSKFCKDSAGTYWLFSTGTGIQIRTSTDRVAWTAVGNVWPSGGYPWADPYTGTADGPLWAPDCTYTNGQFYLYYAASTFGSQKSAIFLATSSTGAPGSWQNLGLVISSSFLNDYNAIDPDLFIDGGNWWLVFGSFWTGIKLIPLNPSTGMPSSPAIYSLAARVANFGAVEAPLLFKNGSYYYLFTSWDRCCAGTSSTYNIRVGRATSVTGPYEDQSGVPLIIGGGTLVLSSHDLIIGPGGQSVYQDTDAVVMDYHWYTSTTSNLGINYLNFSTGWPVAY